MSCKLPHLLMFGIIACASLAPGWGAVSESPYTQNYTTWEPYAADPLVGNSSFHAIRKNITGAHMQSYRLNRRHSDNGVLKRGPFNRLASEAGIALINTHSHVDASAAAFDGLIVYRNVDQNLVDEFIAGDRLMYAELDPAKGEWIAIAEYTWFIAWRPTFNTWRTLVVVSACESTKTFPHIGGRAQVGFNVCLDNEVAGQLLNKLFRRMNGTLPAAAAQGTKRSLVEAHSLGGFTSLNALRIAGETNTTLCPSVAHPATVGSTPSSSDNVYPLGADAPLPSRNGTITGHVIFDTKMDITIPAENVLIYNVLSGMVTVENMRWNGDNRIDFDYRVNSYDYGNGQGMFEVSMTVLGGSAQSYGGGTHKLDGGTINDDRTGSSVHGVAPNADGATDDFVWSFRR